MTWAEIALSVVCAVLIGFAGLLWWERDQAERELDAAQRQNDQRSEDLAKVRRERDQLSDALAVARQVHVFDQENA